MHTFCVWGIKRYVGSNETSSSSAHILYLYTIHNTFSAERIEYTQYQKTSP